MPHSPARLARLARCVALWLALGAAACGGSSGGGPVSAPDEAGPFAVGHLAFTAVDARRGERSIPLDVWYPADPEAAAELPPTRYALIPFVGLEAELAVSGVAVSSAKSHALLVFSHGYEAISTQSVGLMETLASHGFVVVAPTHTGNAQFSGGDPFDTAAARRVPDVSFAIDVMLARAADPGDAFAGAIDLDRIGALGHSFGGMTAIGMRAGWAGAAPDPRVAAIAPISAVIDGELQRDDRPSPNAGFTPEQLARVEVPVLLMGGTADIDVPIGNNRLAFEQLVNAPVVYDVAILGATHTHFANVCAFGELLLEIGIPQLLWSLVGAADLIEPFDATCGPDALPIEEATRLQALYVVSFFRRHLLGERAYGRYLGTAHAATEPDATVELRRQVRTGS